MNSMPTNEGILSEVSARDRRAIAIRFLRSEGSMGELLKESRSDDPQGEQARKTLACVLLMLQSDAPEDLLMTDPPLYKRLRSRITELRMQGWIGPRGSKA